MTESQYQNKVVRELENISKGIKSLDANLKKESHKGSFIEGALMVLNKLDYILPEDQTEIESILKEKGWNGSYGK